MKKMRFAILLVLFAMTGFRLVAQSDMDNLIQAGKQDANYLLEGYSAPFIKAFSSGLNAGWYNTAKTHKWPGFDLTITASLVAIPASDKTYTVDNRKLQSVQMIPSDGLAPTIFGGTTAPTYIDNNSQATIQGPIGMDLPIAMVPVPMAQLGIGLPKGIDVKVRYIPTIKRDVVSIDLFGIGVMHDIKQYIPGVKALPFDLSGFVGFTKFKSSVELNANNVSQVSNFIVNSTTVQGLISKKIAVLTLYAGVGYNLGKGTMQIKGTFDVGNGTTVTDPVDFSVKTSGPRATMGMRLKFKPITFHGDYTFQQYNTINVGFGISVR